MNLRRLCALAIAAMVLSLLPAPGAAHGKNKHGQERSEAQPVPASTPAEGANPGSDNVATPGAGSNAPSKAAQPGSLEHGEGGSLIENLHPAAVHFPIALLIMATLTELFGMARPAAREDSAVRVMLWGGAIGGVIAVALGWIHTGLWFGGGSAMQLHRWVGTGIAFAALLLAWLSGRSDGSRTVLRAGLLVLALAMLAQAYLGGELAHGPNHLALG